jgi:N-methylhydantoinase A
VHAVDVARALEIPRVLVPVSPGVFTALGMLASDLEHHFVRAHASPLATLSLDAVNARLDEIAREARATLSAEGYDGERTRRQFQADLRYLGQGSELTVTLPGERLGPESVSALREAFAREYTATYGYASDEEVELVNLRLIATGLRAHRLDFPSVKGSSAPAPAATRTRRLVSFERGAAPLDTSIVAREAIGTEPLLGPAIIESYDSTVVVPPGCAVAADAAGNLAITIG